MSKNRWIRKVEIEEYKYIFQQAVLEHQESGEPIPVLTPESIEKVNTCLLLPFMKICGISPYPGFLSKASMMFYYLNKNHCLSNGNKRMAVLTTFYFCLKNGFVLNIPEQEFYELIYAVIKSTDEEKTEIVNRIMTIFKKYLMRFSQVRNQKPPARGNMGQPSLFDL